MSPTYRVPSRAARDYKRLDGESQRAFDGARRELVKALREKPPEFAARLRVKRVQSTPGVWELTFAPDGRATFEYGDEITPGEPHVVWRRIGDHSILRAP